MSRSTFSLALGFGFAGLLAIHTANAALPYAYSTLNSNGSRTMCGPYGCTTVPASSLSQYDRSTAYGYDSYSSNRATRYPASRYGYDNDSWYSGRYSGYNGNSRYDDCHRSGSGSGSWSSGSWSDSASRYGYDRSGYRSTNRYDRPWDIRSTRY